MIDRPNISTENQPKGAGANPSDTLDRAPKPKRDEDRPGETAAEESVRGEADESR